MRRILLVLAACLALLAITDGWLRQHQAEQLRLDATLMPLVADSQIVPERVGRMDLKFDADLAYAFVGEGDLWRFPAYHNAVAHADRLERLLQLTLSSQGTLYTSDPALHSSAGMTQPTLQIDLYDRGGAPLTQLQFAGPLPGPAGTESYARIAGTDTVLHLHADPISVVGRGRPPMLDPHLLPRSLSLGALVEIEVEGEGGWRLQRVAALRPETTGPMPPTADQRYRWLLHRGTRIDSCRSGSVAAYLGFLRKVRVDGLTSTRQPASEGSASTRLRLTDEEGVVDELRVAGADPTTGSTLVHNQRAAIQALVAARRAVWLTPPASTFLDSLIAPTPFDRALQDDAGATP